MNECMKEELIQLRITSILQVLIEKKPKDYVINKLRI